MVVVHERLIGIQVRHIPLSMLLEHAYILETAWKKAISTINNIVIYSGTSDPIMICASSVVTTPVATSPLQQAGTRLRARAI